MRNNIEYTLSYIDSCTIDCLTDHHNRDGEMLLAINENLFDVEYSVNDQIGEEFTNVQVAEIIDKIKLAVSKLSNPDGSSLIGEDGFHWFLLTWKEVHKSHNEWGKDEFYEEEQGGC